MVHRVGYFYSRVKALCRLTKNVFVAEYNMLFVRLSPSCDHFSCLETLPRDLKPNFVARGQATYFSDVGGARGLVTCRLSSVPLAITLTSVLFGS
jgi:hypothetical protein